MTVMTLTRKLLIAGLILVFPIYIGVSFIPSETPYAVSWYEGVPMGLGIFCLFTALITWIATGRKHKG